jgi:hypothetical protein
MAQIGSFAAQAEQAGFASVGVIDRLVYDNLDPLIALAAAAARTSPDYFAPARSDTLTSAEGVRAELARLAGAGCTDVVLYPCSGDLDQVERLSQALRSAVTVPDA